jgi:leader peptidase (prepilin peptidase)/N-methyltransferase
MIAIGFLLSFGALTLFVAALLIAAVSDAKTREIPNAAPLLLLIGGVLNILAGGPLLRGIVSALLGLILGGFPLFILALVRKTIGGGDVKLAASAGFVLGWLGSYLTLMVALIGFVLFGLFHLPGKRENDTAQPLPFAPFYAGGCFIILILFAVFRHSLIPSI